MDSPSLDQINQINHTAEPCDCTTTERTADLKTFVSVSHNRPNYQTNDRSYITIWLMDIDPVRSFQALPMAIAPGIRCDTSFLPSGLFHTPENLHRLSLVLYNRPHLAIANFPCSHDCMPIYLSDPVFDGWNVRIGAASTIHSIIRPLSSEKPPNGSKSPKKYPIPEGWQDD